jgi:hypothetical protein
MLLLQQIINLTVKGKRDRIELIKYWTWIDLGDVEPACMCHVSHENIFITYAILWLRL